MFCNGLSKLTNAFFAIGIETIEDLCDPKTLDYKKCQKNFNMTINEAEKLMTAIESCRAAQAFIHECGMSEFLVELIEFGIFSLEELLDPSLITDEDLRISIGMRTLQVRKFRLAVERYHEEAVRVAKQSSQQVLTLADHRKSRMSMDFIQETQRFTTPLGRKATMESEEMFLRANSIREEDDEEDDAVGNYGDRYLKRVPSLEATGMTLVLRTFSGVSVILNDIKPSDTIEYLKERVEEEEGFRKPTLRVFFNGTLLEDEDQVQDYEIDNGSVLFLVIKPTRQHTWKPRTPAEEEGRAPPDRFNGYNDTPASRGHSAPRARSRTSV